MSGTTLLLMLAMTAQRPPKKSTKRIVLHHVILIFTPRMPTIHSGLQGFVACFRIWPERARTPRDRAVVDASVDTGEQHKAPGPASVAHTFRDVGEHRGLSITPATQSLAAFHHPRIPYSFL